jgi:hypothetical protein
LKTELGAQCPRPSASGRSATIESERAPLDRRRSQYDPEPTFDFPETRRSMAKKRTLSGIVRRLVCTFDLPLRRLTIRPGIVMCAPEAASIPANRVTQKLGYRRSPEG